MESDSFHVDPGLIEDVSSDIANANDQIVEGDVQIDLHSYITNYHGYIHYQRLLFISERCPSLKKVALRLAHDYIKQNSLDTTAYNKIFQLLAEYQVGSSTGNSVAPGQPVNNAMARTSSTINGHSPDSLLYSATAEVAGSNTETMRLALISAMSGNNTAKVVYDVLWEESTRRKGTILLDQLETDLKNYKANSIKESIRRGSDDLGDLYLKLGQLNNARKCYTRSRDYCTSQQQEISMCLNVIKVAIFQRAWAQVSAHVTRAYGLSEMQDAILGIPSSTAIISQRGKSSISVRGPTSTGSIRTTGRASTDSSSRLGVVSDSLSNRNLPRSFADGPSVSGGQNYRDALISARSQISIAAGLVELASQNFRAAALSFLQVNPDHCEYPTSSIVTQSDLAYFVTLCSLATFDRTELANQVLGSPHVRLLLEAEPTCRDILHTFHQANYAACLGRLNKLTDFLRLDFFLADHVTSLCREIRNRALCQYFSPYSSADLNTMAQAFDTTVPALEDELAVLIQEGHIKARIDSHKQILRVLNVDQRCLTFARALRLVDEYKRHTQSMVLRMSLSHQRLTCQASRDESDAISNYLG